MSNQTSNKDGRCCADVRDRQMMGMRTHTCPNKAKIIRDGKGYCGIHDPEAVKLKREASDLKYEQQAARERKKWALLVAAPHLLSLARRISNLNPKCLTLGPGMMATLIEEANRAIALAESK